MIEILLRKLIRDLRVKIIKGEISGILMARIKKVRCLELDL